MSETPAPNADTRDDVQVRETRAGLYQVEIRAGGGCFLADEPVAFGGLGTGPNPYDLLGAALGACTAMTLRLYARRKAWPLEAVDVQVSHSRGDLQSRDTFTRQITLTGALDQEQRTKLAAIADRCPVHLTLERGADVATQFVDAPADDAAAQAGLHLRDMREACGPEGRR